MLISWLPPCPGDRARTTKLPPRQWVSTGASLKAVVPFSPQSWLRGLDDARAPPAAIGGPAVTPFPSTSTGRQMIAGWAGSAAHTPLPSTPIFIWSPQRSTNAAATVRKGRITAGQIQTSPELLWKLNLFPEARSAPAGCRGWALKQQPCSVFPQTVCVCHPAAPCFALAQVEGGRHCFLLGFLTPIHPQLSKSGSFAFLLLFSFFFFSLQPGSVWAYRKNCRWCRWRDGGMAQVGPLPSVLVSVKC